MVDSNPSRAASQPTKRPSTQHQKATTDSAAATSMGPPATSSASPRMMSDEHPPAKLQKVADGSGQEYGTGEYYDAGKAAEDFRNYKDSVRQVVVENHCKCDGWPS